MIMLPEPTEVMPTRNPANSPIPDIPAKDFIVGGRPATCSSILVWKSINVGMQTSNSPTAEVMKLFTPLPYTSRRCARKVTPRIEPGMLPTASATTTLRRTVPLRRCIHPEPIFVTKLKTASDPTARIGGTLRPRGCARRARWSGSRAGQAPSCR